MGCPKAIRWIAQKPFAQHDLLLVAAGEAGNGIEIAPGADLEALDRLATRLDLARRADDEIRAEILRLAILDIAANAVAQIKPGELPILGDERDALGDRLTGRGERDGLPESLISPLEGRSRPNRQSKISLRPEPIRP